MNTILEYLNKVQEWVKDNPTKATIIILVVAAFVLGAIIF